MSRSDGTELAKPWQISTSARILINAALVLPFLYLPYTLQRVGVVAFAATASGVITGVIWTSGHEVARRVLASGIYFLVCLFLMCCSNSIAWYRNPTGQAVLPDILHELLDPVHVVRLPGGIELDPHAVIETIVGVTLIVSVLVIFSQPARWLIFRRGVVVYSTLALFRAVTVLVTTLPDARSLCHQHTTGPFAMKDINYRAVLINAMENFIPVNSFTCGDMVFSGHTMGLVTFGMVCTTYIKSKPGVWVFNWAKIMIWCAISVALTLIVVTRMHYTLDVLLGLYFTVTLWGAYHRIADDITIGHSFASVWLVDSVLVYPAIAWMECPQLGEARSGVITQYRSQRMLEKRLKGMREQVSAQMTALGSAVAENLASMAAQVSLMMSAGSPRAEQGSSSPPPQPQARPLLPRARNAVKDFLKAFAVAWDGRRESPVSSVESLEQEQARARSFSTEFASPTDASIVDPEQVTDEQLLEFMQDIIVRADFSLARPRTTQAFTENAPATVGIANVGHGVAELLHQEAHSCRSPAAAARSASRAGVKPEPARSAEASPPRAKAARRRSHVRAARS